MSAEDLHSLLARLHSELQGSPQLDAESRQRLQELGADLSRLGQGDAPVGAAHASRFAELVGRFEGAHPSLAGSLREMADALARAGL
jgi:hypothetical protein